MRIDKLGGYETFQSVPKCARGGVTRRCEELKQQYRKVKGMKSKRVERIKIVVGLNKLKKVKGYK
jgi:hypothetical protein